MLISVDPGKTTGIIIASADSTYKDIKILHAVEMLWEDRYSFTNMLTVFTPTVIIVEDFRVVYNKSQPLAGYRVYSSELIGRVDDYCHHNDIEYVLQQPSVKARVHIPKDVKLTGEHLKDAYKHLKYYLVKRDLK